MRMQKKLCQLFNHSPRRPLAGALCNTAAGAILTLLVSFPVFGQTNAGPARPVGLQEAFAMALTNNLTLQIERLNPLVSAEALALARGYYDPTFALSGLHNHYESGASFSQGIVRLASSSDGDTFESSLNGRGPYGLSYGLSGNLAASDVTRGNEPFSTSSGGGGFNVAQPLLRGFLMDEGRYNILLTKNEIKQSQYLLQLQIMTLLNQVEQAYYNLIFARENIRVQQKGLELAQRLLEENKKRVQIGTLSPLDEKQAESQVAARQTDLTTAMQTYKTVQNIFKRLLTGNYRGMHQDQLEPTVGLVAVPVEIDLQESWTRAMTQRPDLAQARLELERQGITLKYAKNQLLPELDIRGSYGYNANGEEFSDSIDDLFRRDKPYYTAGASVSFPIGNRAARARYQTSKLNVQSALLRLKDQEQAILVRVDEAASQVKTAYAQVASGRAARFYAEEALDAEQKKLEFGKSTSFVVLQLQRDLTAARSDELRALADYNKAQAQLIFEEGQTLKRNNLNLEVK